MPLITDEYRELNRKLHEVTGAGSYGVCGGVFAPDVLKLTELAKSTDVLDYGCGKGHLGNNLPFPIKQYDPAIEKHEAMPVAADVVVCTEVFEHVEEDCIDDVLIHIKSLMKICGYFTANIKKAKKVLADGRNAHVLLRSPKWWFNIIDEYFDVISYQQTDMATLIFMVRNQELANEQKVKEPKKDDIINEIPHEPSASEKQIAIGSVPQSDFLVGVG